MFDKLEDLVRRLEELNIELTDPDVISNQDKYRQLMKENGKTIFHTIFCRSLRNIRSIVRQKMVWKIVLPF